MIEEQELEGLERDIIEVNGLLVDASTGEVLSLVIEQDEPFRVHDKSSAEWVLEKLSDAEADVSAIAARREVLNANLDAMELPAQRRAHWLRLRFAAELEEWARSELEGKKERTIRTPFGSLSFRKVKARLKVDDEARALSWCRENLPGAVKVVESVLVSEVSPHCVEPLGLVPPGFAIEAASDRFSVKTGQGS